jgi:glutamine---fructose-6-phosphate transaminase (isomerizing)
MCGLFGIVRNPDSLNDIEAMRRGAITIRALGVNSEERGVHSSGLAMVDRGLPFSSHTPNRVASTMKEVALGNTYIVKSPGKFSDLPISDTASEKLVGCNVVIGHTRYATQGNSTQLSNASPLLAGTLVGTHNGDVLKSTILGEKELRKLAVGATDSELLYLALSLTGGSRKEMVGVLRKAIGRIALAYIDRTNTDRLILARGALSPISYAWTNDGDFVYASNPDWFRRIEKETKGAISFRDITLLPAGRLITIDTRTATIVNSRKFTPSCRDTDLYLLRTGIYKKFTVEDRTAFQTLDRHKVYATTISEKWAEPLVVEGYKEQVEYDFVDTPDMPPPLFELEGDEDTFEWVDEDSLEMLCSAVDGFEEDVYLHVLTADSEEEAQERYAKLYFDILKIWEKGMTQATFDMAKVKKPI